MTTSHRRKSLKLPLGSVSAADGSSQGIAGVCQHLDLSLKPDWKRRGRSGRFRLDCVCLDCVCRVGRELGSGAHSHHESVEVVAR